MSAHRVIGLLAELRNEHGADALADVSTVDLGGGLGIAYTAADDPPPTRLARRAAAQHRGQGVRARRAWRCRRIAVEPGRAIVGPGTVTLYEVGTIKDVELGHGSARRYVSVDGGMSDNIRTALYDADYDCRLLSRFADEGARGGDAVLSRVVGKHCESGDVVVRDCWLPENLAPGDLVAVAATGAYCYAMALELQPAAAPGRGRGARRARPGCCCAAKRWTTCCAWRSRETPGGEG